MNHKYKFKRIAGKENLAQHRKAIFEKQKWDNELPQGEGPLNKDRNPKHPPGQRIITNWPVLDLGVQPKIELEDRSSTISGLIDTPKMFSWDDFMSLPQVEDVSDFHCVTSWSHLNNHWGGGRLMDIANYCGVVSTAKFVYIKAYGGLQNKSSPNRGHETGCFASSSVGRSSVNN